MTETSPRTFCLRVTLLEDLHTGSGMGSTLVDRLLARAPDGTPVIPAGHVKGVWRDNALRLVGLGLIDGAEVDRLFGTQSGQRGTLVAPELSPESGQTPGQPIQTLFWDATARKQGERAPDDHSLRRTEYLPAELVLKGRGRITKGTPESVKALEAIVRFTNALGSERTRGSGLIRAELEWHGGEQNAPDPAFGPAADPAADLTQGVRLLLRADAPLCIPTTGAPGNIIPSEHHIPGRTLFGALAAWCLDHGAKPKALFERALSVGPGYPLPRGLACEGAEALAAIAVMPMPLNLGTPKPGERDQTTWPHWASAAGGDSAPAFCDRLAPAPKDDAELARIECKRPKDNAYLVRSGDGPWQAYGSPLGLRMRNRRGDPLARDVKETEADLFTVEQMPAGTCFVADIHPRAADEAQGLHDLMKLLGLTDGPAPVLRIGRGGAPVTILGWCPSPSGVGDQGTDNPQSTLTVTLTSDLIARAPDLCFHETLTVEALRDALGPGAPPAIPCDAQSKARVFSDSLRYQSFNAVSGLPAAPRIAIRRGSVLRVEGPCAAALKDALKGRAAIGEQTWEGNGRFALNLQIDAAAIRRPEGGTPSEPDAGPPAARTDRVIAAAESLVAQDRSLRWLPGRAQLGNLRALLADAAESLPVDAFQKLLGDFRDELKNRRAGADWNKAFDDYALVSTLVTACCKDGTCRTEDAELFLRVLVVNRAEAETEGKGEAKAPNTEQDT